MPLNLCPIIPTPQPRRRPKVWHPVLWLATVTFVMLMRRPVLFTAATFVWIMLVTA
jgi:hypothetical protein